MLQKVGKKVGRRPELSLVSQVAILQLIASIARVDSMNILGVVLRCDLSFHKQVNSHNPNHRSVCRNLTLFIAPFIFLSFFFFSLFSLTFFRFSFFLGEGTAPSSPQMTLLPNHVRVEIAQASGIEWSESLGGC